MSPTRRFVHLHTHSEYSQFDGLSTVERIVQAAAEDDQGAVAITDHGSIASLWVLKNAAAKAGIKPIPGIEAYMAVSGTRYDLGSIQVAADAEEGDAGDGVDERSSGRRTKSKSYEHLTILARTRDGLRNLILLANKSQESKHRGRPLMDYELLAEHGDGLIVLTGCIGGPVAGPLSRITGENPDVDEAERSRARANLEKLIAAVGRENVYVEVADHGIPGQHSAMEMLYSIADEYGVKAVAANDSHFIKEREQPMQEGWIALGLSTSSKRYTISSEDRYKFSGSGHFFRTAAQMHAVRPDDERWQQACDETARIADRVEEDIYPPTRLRVPRFAVPASFTPSSRELSRAREGEDAQTLAYFRHLVRKGSAHRFGKGRPEQQVVDRLSHEFEIIRGLGMMDYFLIVADIIEWARSDYTARDWIDRDTGARDVREDDPQRERKSPILVGPGRGSAAGSLVSYVLGIVNVDPLKNGLLFERFLDPDRAEMPDIDVDFEKERRAEVIAYIAERYGHDNVCYLGIHGTNQTKAALDSAGRYLEVSAAVTTEIKKLLHEDTPPIAALLTAAEDPGPAPSDLHGAALKAHEARQEAHLKGADLRAYYREHPELQQFFRFASVYEGVVTNPGKHACGFVISDEPLLPLVPMRLNKDGQWETEWDGNEVAEFGLLKMDILGLRTLDIARAAEDNARAEHEHVDFDFMHLNTEGPLAERTWAMLAKGQSVGVFQLESSGMRDLLTTAHPKNLDDLSALIAAFRPGPMSAGMHTDWAQRTGGHRPVSYDTLTEDPQEQETIASVLGETSGVILFQEQMMRLGKIVGNFTAAEANQLRRAISKKKQAMLDELRPRFIEGAQQPGVGEDGSEVPPISRATAERLWVAFEGSGAYAFNKSHTTAYGALAYQTAYLKANWPAEFGAATLRYTGTGTDKADRRIAAMNSLREEGIEIKAPDVNMSEAQTVARDGVVWIGLSEIKGVGKIAHDIVAERAANGPFTSMADLVARVRTAPDERGTRRSVTASQLSALIAAGAFDAWGTRAGHLIASRAIAKNPEVPIPSHEWGVIERSARQREVLRATFGEHPTVTLAEQIRLVDKTTDEADPKEPVRLEDIPLVNGRSVDSFGIVSSIVPRYTRKGDRMMTMDLESDATVLKTVAFSRVVTPLEAAGELPRVGDLVRVRGEVQVREFEREVTDEETGETTSEVITERSVLVNRVEQMDVADPARERDRRPVLRVGSLLMDGSGGRNDDIPSPGPGPDDGSDAGPEAPGSFDDDFSPTVLIGEEPPDVEPDGVPQDPEAAAAPPAQAAEAAHAEPEEATDDPAELLRRAERTPLWQGLREQLGRGNDDLAVSLCWTVQTDQGYIERVHLVPEDEVREVDMDAEGIEDPEATPIVAVKGPPAQDHLFVIVQPGRAMEDLATLRSALDEGRWPATGRGSVAAARSQ